MGTFTAPRQTSNVGSADYLDRLFSEQRGGGTLMTNEEAICQRIKSAREDAGMTQADTAAALGVTLRAYSHYEKNRVPWPRLGDLAGILNTSRKVADKRGGRHQHRTC